MQEDMPEKPAIMNPETRHAAFGLAFSDSRSPLPYETHTDKELLPGIRELAPAASPEECLEALARIRSLCDTVYEVCEAFRTGKFGAGAVAREGAIKELSRKNSGFSEAEYEAAFAAGLLWTAF
jgi:hypothetical protein